MLKYSDDLRLAHMMKEWFYDISQLESYRKQQQKSMIGFLMQEDAVLKNSRNVQKRFSPGEKKS